LEIFWTRSTDQDLEFQENLAHSGLLVVVIVAVSNALEDLLPAVPVVLAALTEPAVGSVVRIDAARR
jgi:hypothetical protein